MKNDMDANMATHRFLLRELYGGQVSWATSNPHQETWPPTNYNLGDNRISIFIKKIHVARHTNRCLK